MNHNEAFLFCFDVSIFIDNAPLVSHCCILYVEMYVTVGVCRMVLADVIKSYSETICTQSAAFKNHFFFKNEFGKMKLTQNLNKF